MDYLKSFREMLSLRGLTSHTIKSYSTYISAYLDYLSLILHKIPEDVSWQELRDFIFWLQKERSLSDRTMNAAISQLRFFTLYVLHQPWDPCQLPFRKFDRYLPFVPSRQQMSRFLFSVSDLRFRAVLFLMFSAGLRVSEVTHLKCSDIERSKARIHIRSSKNRSDRYVILSPRAYNALLEYWCSFPSGQRPSDWLFTQVRNKNNPMDAQEISRFILNHEKELGWEHHFTCHTFRHSYATFLYEDGTDLLTIKELLGHKSLESTLIYIHLASRTLSSIASPLDILGGISHE